MSDKQKVLTEAFSEVMPSVSHRFFVRHLHNNFKRQKQDEMISLSQLTLWMLNMVIFHAALFLFCCQVMAYVQAGTALSELQLVGDSSG